jgi:hypothetical protein
LLEATKFSNETGDHPQSIATLRRRLSEANALAKKAKAVGDIANYKNWFDRSVQIAEKLANYEAAKLQAILTTPSPPEHQVTEITFRVFERERRPLQIEATATPVADTAPAAEAKVIDADPVKLDREEKPTAPQAAPTAPPPPENVYGTSNARVSMFDPCYGNSAFRLIGPFGSRHRN